MTHTPTLTRMQMEAFGRELDAIRAEVIADLGQADVDYIRRIIKAQRAMEVAGRAIVWFPLTWLPGNGPAVGVEDPGQHGDRAQHHARPVRMDR